MNKNTAKAHLLKKCLTLWIVLAFVVSFACGLAYFVIQQNYRLSANDPQIQVVQDISRALAGGQSPQTMFPPTKFDINQSLAPFLVVFDSSNNLVASMVTVDGKDPVIPKGVFDITRRQGQDRFTWQPKAGVRVAAVISYYNQNKNSGFVLVGRSLSEVEKRIDLLGLQVGLFWVVGLLGSALLSGLVALLYTSTITGKIIGRR